MSRAHPRRSTGSRSHGADAAILERPRIESAGSHRELLNKRFVKPDNRDLLERRDAEGILSRGAHLARDEHEEWFTLCAVGVRVSQLDELGTCYRELCH